MNRSIFFLISFVVVSAAEIMALTFDWPGVHEVAKPMIMLSLIGYYLSVAKMRSPLFVRALFFGWAGDVLLLFQEENAGFFIGGLVAFLIGHVLYILSFRKSRWTDVLGGLLPTQRIRFSFPVLLAGCGLITLLFPHLGNLKIPVIIYAVVLMVMALSALDRFGRTTSTSFWFVMSGAILFMISDSVLAINKFYSPFPYGGVVIMITYISAQYLIVRGVMEHPVVNTQTK
ncbi:MAG: lysoplasmalogenase [Cyclobacteriaceae bacterium]|nr:lysoplasmalogenase [Cyclobacteriaceae bacterium]